MRKRPTHFIIACCIIFLSIPGYTQKSSISFGAGISSSAIPIYTKNVEAVVLSRHSVNNLSFMGSFNYGVNKHFQLKSELSYNRIGGNSVFKLPSQEGFFVHNASLNYLTLAVLPQFNLAIGRYTISGSLGPSAAYLLKEKLINFQYEENVLVGREQESSNLEKIDYGINATVEISRLIANNFRVLLAVRKYQGLVDINRNEEGESIYIENAILNLGLMIPIKN